MKEQRMYSKRKKTAPDSVRKGASEIHDNFREQPENYR